MNVILFKDYQLLSAFASGEIAEAIKNNSALTLCMASGHTPALTCDLLVKKLQEDRIDYSKISFLGLDEWVGLPPTNEGSCHYFFQKRLFEPLQLRSSQCFLFNALADNLKSECFKMDKLISEKGGINIMLVGIGMNGHIGFNEPGTSFTSLSHIAVLDDTTKTVGQKYFQQQTKLEKGISIGLGHVMNSKKVFLLANGNKKAGVIKKALEEPVTEAFPASIMQQHANGFVLIDEEAGSLLSKSKYN